MSGTANGASDYAGRFPRGSIGERATQSTYSIRLEIELLFVVWCASLEGRGCFSVALPLPFHSSLEI